MNVLTKVLAKERMFFVRIVGRDLGAEQYFPSLED
jgi:hypothetical protein